MSARRKWLTKLYSDSQDNKSERKEDISISWSSSEEESFDSQRKKLKINKSACVLKCEEWINNFNYNLVASGSRGAKILNLARSTSKTEQICNSEEISCTPSRKIEPHESPIISGFIAEELSPVITSSSEITVETASPILGKNTISRKSIYNRKPHSEMKSNKTVCVKQEEDSPDLFPTQESRCYIIESESPIKKHSSESPIENSVISQSGSLYKIDPLLSQDSSNVLINSDSNVSVPKTNECLLQYKYPPVKKKKYKKGGLCSQLQKVIRTQKSRVAIWQHELIQGRLCDSNIFCKDKEIHYFYIKREWKEFGCFFFECECLPNCSCISPSLEVKTTYVEPHLFILCLGFTVVPNIKYKVDSKYILYPPYTQKYILYNKVNTVCYLNASKISKYKN